MTLERWPRRAETAILREHLFHAQHWLSAVLDDSDKVLLMELAENGCRALNFVLETSKYRMQTFNLTSSLCKLCWSRSTTGVDPMSRVYECYEVADGEAERHL